MDSINKQQAEHNHQDLVGSSAIHKMAELVRQAQTCFFCTDDGHGRVDARPMSVLQVDEEGNLCFLSANDSHKNLELRDNPAVRLFFQGSPHAEFMHLEGVATVSRDKAKIRDLWKFVLKTWFTEGEDDPRITVIKVAPSHGYYWDNKHGNAVAGIKMLIGATIGKTLDDSIEGKLTV
ncbi:MAG: pyridoxamine 5'-phosphate oxidase family protein [Pseudomonadota bacterium]